jgi:DNA polymerase-4
LAVPWPRAILHVDMDAFFASVEQLDDPSLRGKPVLVGHDGPRGVVAAASYEARVYGCRSAQPMAVAKRLCPQAVVVRGHFDRYREESRKVFTILESFTPAVEPLSIDEAFLDVTGSQGIFGEPEDMARAIKQRIRAETRLTGSVGVAANKFLAKLASDMDKPDGLTVIRPQDVDRVLPPLPIGKIWGIGPKTAERLEGIGVRTIGDLRKLDADVLSRRLGTDAEHYRRLAFGLDDREVTPDDQAKSIGHEQTFGQDLADPEEVRRVMLEQSEQVSARLRRHRLFARGVTVKIRYGDFQTVTRARKLDAPADTTQPIWHAARELFDTWAREFKPVRLIGVTATRLTEGEPQLELFADLVSEKQRRVDSAVDRINARFGKAAIGRARAAEPPRDATRPTWPPPGLPGG